MNSEIKNLKPVGLWKNFANLNAVPRASKKEEQVIQFIVDFANGLGLDTHIDEIGNVIVKKDASPGMEDRQTIVLQSHLDMVHQKNRDTTFDFATEGIKMLIDNDWVKADGTTLGADNGIGVATIMAVLESKDIEHPPIEALFTIDEETGMTGALGLKGGLLSGSILLNLDTEDDRELTIGCAGGIDITGKGSYITDQVASDTQVFKITLKGLSGGHSGMDIHKGFGNANKLMNRVLYRLNKHIKLSINTIDGGGLRNAIPRESFSVVVIHKNQIQDFKKILDEQTVYLKKEHGTTDPDLDLIYEDHDQVENVMNHFFQDKLLKGVYSIPNGIYRMSPEIDGLVQTSNNLARILVKDGSYKIMCLTRSSVDTEKNDLSDAISGALELIGADVKLSGEYPGWKPKPEAAIVKLMSDLYKQKFSEEPHVNACHAGLECGIIGTNYPEMDMISFGPNILGAHSPDEKVQISSVQKFWDYFLDTLKSIPKQN